ncbi:hypothetical protein [uncultured Bacteroides sp.]|uniref:hypothetical protein n=1 Tax=uncultured Bacteroides sp. TaxID=162156 RepID=UPI00259AB6A3|nr:hypothetical protein [uncultured Bacteroides sp.]
MNETISIAGVPVGLVAIARDDLRGLSLDLQLSFRFYRAEFNRSELCIASPTDSSRSYTPRQYARYAALVERTLNLPVAFLLPAVPFYVRKRLIEQGVYFIISDQYVFLPGILMNERIGKPIAPEQPLSPVAQYLLLYFLLHKEIQEFTIQEIQPRTPYNYLAVSRAVSELEAKRLLQAEKEWKTKLLFSSLSRKELWEKALSYLVSPIKKTIYSDEKWSGPFYTGGISALSHYSFLNPDDQQTLVIWERDFIADNKTFTDWGTPDFKYKIEIWKYSPQMGAWQDEYVDKLSLYLSMRGDNDPRVEKELETIINEIWQ